MFNKLLKAKLHNATITFTDVNYNGSITIDTDLLQAAGMKVNEAVLVADTDNGARFNTYIIPGKPGSGEVGINGAAAHLVKPGHRVIIMSFGYFTPDETDAHKSRVIVCDASNRIAERLEYETR